MPSSPKIEPDLTGNNPGLSVSGDDIIEIGVVIEEIGRNMYLEAEKSARSSGLKELFRTLAAEEEKHITTFREMAPGTDKSTSKKVAASKKHIKALLKSNAFFNAGVVKEMLADAEEHGTAVMLAIRFEKETLLLLHGMKEFVQEKDLRVVEGLIDEEKRHIEQLSQHLEQVRDNKSDCPEN
jgi:rubrerythrin